VGVGVSTSCSGSSVSSEYWVSVGVGDGVAICQGGVQARIDRIKEVITKNRADFRFIVPFFLDGYVIKAKTLLR
jgi:hypothetical protein